MTRYGYWALVNVIMNLQVPYNAGNFLTSWKAVSFSRMTLLHGVGWGTVILELNEIPHHEDAWRNLGIVSCILYTGTRRILLASFIPWLLHSLGKIPCYTDIFTVLCSLCSFLFRIGICVLDFKRNLWLMRSELELYWWKK